MAHTGGAPVTEAAIDVEEELPDVNYTRQQQEEDWLYFQLEVARKCRRKMERLDSESHDRLILAFEREAALKSAAAHAHNLRVEGFGVPPLLITMMQAEGLV